MLGVSVPSVFAKTLPTNPKRPYIHSFVKRSGTHLILRGRPFRFGGANIYWLGLDENVGGVHYPTYFRIKDALQTASDMGVTVVRSQTLGVSTGNSLSLEPSLGKFNDTAFDTIDYAIYQARKLGIRLLIPLTDNYHYYHGGKHNFTDWLGLPESQFYTNPKAIKAFKVYIKHVLNHVNPYTGVALKNDPAVLAWELGNELNGMPKSWINTISAYIHQLAPRQLVAAGQQKGINPATLTAPNVDIVDVHYYPPSSSQMMADAKEVTDAGKVYIAGEYASTAASTSLLTPLVGDKKVSGAMFWSLFAHNDTYGYVQHNDGFTLHYPGDNSAMQKSAQAIRQFDYAVRGIKTPVENAPGQPLITGITKKDGENIISWRGTTDASKYTVQRSTSGADGPWKTICNQCATDNDTPWMDLNSPASKAWYRVIAQNLQGKNGKPSQAVSAGENQGTLVDPLETWSNTYSHSDGLKVIPSGYGVQVLPAKGRKAKAPKSGKPGNLQITWSHLDIVGFKLRVTSHTPHIPLKLFVSRDGSEWKRAAPKVSILGHKEYRLSLSNLNHVKFVKVEWANHRGKANGHSAAITEAMLHYSEPAIVDNLNDWTNVYSHSANLVFDHTNPQLFEGDMSRVKRTTSTNENIVWHLDGMKTFKMTTYFWPDGTVSPFSIYTSPNASKWTKVKPAITKGSGNWLRYNYSVSNLDHANDIKVVWNHLTGKSYTPQISQVKIYGSVPFSVPNPSSFAQKSPTAGATGVITKPKFVWDSADNAAYYSIVVSKHSDFSDPVIDVKGIQSADYTSPTKLAPGTTYYWRVTAANTTDDTSATNAGESFTTSENPKSPLTVEDFSEYGGSNASLQSAYQANPNGDPISVSLNSSNTDGSKYSMAVNYTIGSSGYAGVSHNFSAPQNLSGYKGLQFWLKPDGSGSPITIQFVANGVYWQDTFTPSGTSPMIVKLPFTDFTIPSWAQSGPLDLTSVSQLSIYVGGNARKGTLYFDSFKAYPGTE